MTYGKNFSYFFKSNNPEQQEVVKRLEELSTGDLLANLRNIEEAPHEYDEATIKAVYSALYKRNIICI